MAQFDVYRNTGRQREIIPFIVAVQSSLYDDYGRQVVIPLVKASALGTIANPRLNPTFKILRVSENSPFAAASCGF
jgi:toxin CcdB